MIQFNKKVLFLFFAASIFLLAMGVNSIIDGGFKSGKELFYQLAPTLSFACSSIVFFIKLYTKVRIKQ